MCAGFFGLPNRPRLKLHLQGKVATIPASLSAYNLQLAADGDQLIYTYDTKSERTGITSLLGELPEQGGDLRPIVLGVEREDQLVAVVRKLQGVAGERLR